MALRDNDPFPPDDFSNTLLPLYHHATALLCRQALVKWQPNGLRHSFASYHLAKHQNAPALSLELGHTSPRMLFDHYRELVTPKEAERYWSIRPEVSR